MYLMYLTYEKLKKNKKKKENKIKKNEIKKILYCNKRKYFLCYIIQFVF